jgi:hypothetical protein
MAINQERDRSGNVVPGRWVAICECGYRNPKATRFSDLAAARAAIGHMRVEAFKMTPKEARRRAFREQGREELGSGALHQPGHRMEVKRTGSRRPWAAVCECGYRSTRTSLKEYATSAAVDHLRKEQLVCENRRLQLVGRGPVGPQDPPAAGDQAQAVS